MKLGECVTYAFSILPDSSDTQYNSRGFNAETPLHGSMTSENTDSDSTSTGGGTPDFKKIDKIVFRYSLDGLREDMKRLYEDEGQSYRNIKQYVNKRILETELERRGQDLLPGEVENYLRILKREDDDISRGQANDARERLKEMGINVGELEGNLVSHQTVGNYLKEELDVDVKQRGEANIENSRGTITGLVGRLQSVATREVEKLVENEFVNIGDFDVMVNVQVQCRDCGRLYSALDLLRNRKCDCYDTAPDLEEAESAQEAA